MSNINNLATAQLPKSTLNGNVLQSGSTVFVRVLSQGKGNEYLVSVAGNTLNVFSKSQLQVGTAFRALVTINEGKVFLSPQATERQNNVQKLSANADGSLEKLSGFLENLGLKSDSISLRIVQYLQSAGIRFNTHLASKARSIGLQFPGKEEEATEVALFLEQRGIHADVDTVMDVLGLLYGDDAGEQRKKKHWQSGLEGDMAEKDSDTQVQGANDSAEEANTDDVRNDLLFFLYEKESEVCNRREGLLTYLNQYCTNTLHWIILPFESGTEENKIRGNIRLLLHFDKKNSEKMVIDAFFCGKNYKIMIKYMGKGESTKQRYKIRFCTDTKKSEADLKYICNILASCLPKDMSFDIAYSDELLTDGIFALGSPISVVALEA